MPGEYLWSYPEPVAAFAATNAGDAGANQRIGLCAWRYAAVRLRNLGRGRICAGGTVANISAVGGDITDLRPGD